MECKFQEFLLIFSKIISCDKEADSEELNDLAILNLLVSLAFC